MKNLLKSALCLLMALLMTLSLAACGSQSTVTEDARPAETEAPDELVYAASFQTMAEGPENGLTPIAYTADGFYALSWEKTGEREIPEDAVISYEGEYDIYGSVLYFAGYDGSLRKLDAYSGMAIPEDTEDRDDYYGSSNLEKLFVNEDGTLTALETVYVNWYDGPESERYGDNQWEYRQNRQYFYVRQLDKDGGELSSMQLDFKDEDAYLNFSSSQLDEKGNLLVICEQQLIAFAPDGSVAYSLESPEYIDTIFKLKDGRLGVTFWGNAGVELHLIDTESGSFGPAEKCPHNAYSFMSATNSEYDLYYQNGSSLYGFNLGEESGVKILNWLDVDVNPDQMNGFQMLDNGSIIGIISDWSKEQVSNEMVTLNLVPASSLPKKETLTLAVMYMDYQVQNKIIDFNRHSDTTRIQVKDYSEFNTEEDYTAGLTKLTTEIMAGNLPDLLSLNQLPYDQLASKGLLEDLYPYLDADKELSREGFFPTVMAALEVNGGLYQAAPSFQIVTLIGASSVVGNHPGWTYDQFNAALASMPAGCTPLDQYTTREDILRRLVTLEMESLVDWNTGKCSFDSDTYVNILNFSNRFQEEFDWESYEWTADESTETRIAEGRQMLMAGNIYSVDDLMYNDFYFGGDATYIGYPTSSGVGSMMSLSSGFAMSSKCRDKDAAWAFLRTILSEKYQDDIWGMPINKNAFDKKLKEAMTVEYQKDAEGNYLLDENGEKIQASRGGIGMADGTVHDIYALTQEQADKLLEVINSTTRVVNNNDSLLKLIVDEAQPFFAGQKSAEEVARLTQSKVNLYVNEQR